MTLANANTIPTSWLKAGIIGSTWAAFEIIIGSFLHNLQIPFAGTILSAGSVFLLISFLQIWNQRGIVVKAGLICALMKSISPSAVIIGPMVGIFMEALLLEAFLLLLGRNLVGFMLSGAVAVMWSLTQKVLFLLLMYGMDLIELASSLYQYLIRISGIDNLSSLYLIGGIAVLYAIVGALAAYGGYVSGRSYTGNADNAELQINNADKKNILKTNSHQRFSIALLFVIVGTIALSLFFINNQMYWKAGISGVVFVTFCILRYRNSTQYLKKPHIWIQFLLITTVAALLWEWAATGNYFSVKGLTIGLEMNYRALIIVFGFAAVGVELRNPVIKTLLYQKGFRQLHHTLSFAFATLPAIIDSLPKPVSFIKRRKAVVAQLLNQSQNLLRTIEQQKR